ncbi:peptidase M56 [Clostridioides sp. ZZV14-6045]|uniref:M56 family metallopeptidase n=1 Tax=Clostridioides sp. ZZV14-6045 TaxID=2811489 RepID=UPI001D120D22|nr:peptidase M56 [Clostridioides sp. ZZV14-6045]
MADLILKDIFRTSVISSLLICFLLLFKLTIFRIFNKSFNYYIWLIVIVKLLFPFSYFTYTISDSKFQYKPILNGVDYSNTVLIIYLTIVILLATYRLRKYLSFKSLAIDLSYDIENVEINNLYNDLLKELNIKKHIKLKYTYEINTPSFFGLFDNYIFLPPHNYNLDELYWILKHELVHYKSKDLYIRYLVLFLKCVYFFNPFVYILDRIIYHNCELHCDETVLKSCSLANIKSYANTILDSIERNSIGSNNYTTGLHRKSNFEKRVYNMFKIKTRKGILVALLLCLLSLVTYLKLDYLSSSSSNYLFPKKAPIETRSNSKAEFYTEVEVN